MPTETTCAGADGADEAVDHVIDTIADAPDPEGKVESFHTRGATIVAEEFGSGSPVFVLIHGIGMGRGVFAELISLLDDAAHVIAIDQPGYGDSPEPVRTPTMERTADIIADLLISRSVSQAVVIGHSMGTQVAAELAARHPSLVGRLVLVAPTVDISARKPLPQILRLGRDLLHESVKVLLLGAREYVRAGPHLVRKLRAMLVHSPEFTYPRISQPTLVLRGGNDVVCPEPWCRLVTELLPRGQFVEIPHLGHETLIRNAQPAVAEITAFLSRTGH